MTESPSDILTAVADDLRHTGTPVDHLLADVLDAAAADFSQCTRINERDPHNDGKTRVMPLPLAVKVLAYATALTAADPVEAESDQTPSTAWRAPDPSHTPDPWDRQDQHQESFDTWFTTHFTGGWEPSTTYASNDPEDSSRVGVFAPLHGGYRVPPMSYYDTDNVVMVACRSCGAVLPLHTTWVKEPMYLNAHRAWHDRLDAGSSR